MYVCLSAGCGKFLESNGEQTYWKNFKKIAEFLLCWLCYQTIFSTYKVLLSVFPLKNWKKFSKGILSFCWHTICLYNWWSSKTHQAYQNMKKKYFIVYPTQKQMFADVLQNRCWSLCLIKLQSWRPASLLKRDCNKGVFLWILRNI